MPRKSDISAQNEAISQIPRTNPLQDDFGWTVPVESVPLPSSGKIYPQSSPLHKREVIEIKAMTAHEEDILMSRALIRDGSVMTHLINSCVIDKSINAKDMLLGDRNSLMIAVRITGYGPSYKAETSCPACDTKQQANFDLSDLTIKRLEIDPIAPGVNQFEFILPISKKRVVFKFMTGRDDEEQSLLIERRKKIMPDIQVDGVVTMRHEFSIVSIDGITDKNKISTFIRAMPALDSRTLRNYISEHEPGIDMTGSFRCSHCGVEARVPLPLGPSFFWP